MAAYWLGRVRGEGGGREGCGECHALSNDFYFRSYCRGRHGKGQGG